MLRPFARKMFMEGRKMLCPCARTISIDARKIYVCGPTICREAHKKRGPSERIFSMDARKERCPCSCTIARDERKKLRQRKHTFQGRTKRGASLCTKYFQARTQNAVPVIVQFPGKHA
jgi:hypothetical protein